MKRMLAVTMGLFLAVAGVVPAWACGGLVAPNGAVNLRRTTTLAAYHNGVEHYITSFEFKGGGAKFGSLVPLPDLPKKVTRGGKWTLQRLVEEVRPPQPVAAEGSTKDSGAAKEVYETEIDGLLITILEGGAKAVGKWAKNEGFGLSPDAPEVLDFYAKRSPYFMAARFIPKKARREKLRKGDAIPIHLRIPTDDPWVPLRILALGKAPEDRVKAKVFLLTDIEPATLPVPVEPGNGGLVLKRSEQASQSLMDDLSSDKGMGWMPESMWLTFIKLTIDSKDLTYDLAIDATGAGQPSESDAYGAPDESSGDGGERSSGAALWAWLLIPVLGLGTIKASARVVMPPK